MCRFPEKCIFREIEFAEVFAKIGHKKLQRLANQSLKIFHGFIISNPKQFGVRAI